ncbi:MAG: phosphotransferase [Coleofasciculaceae cyanobacterium RL_1_1]|nr:phosphotransferase [Coleofasciculaceae cyanobacterium RL_1_1]
MNSAFPVTHSILSVPALLAKIAVDYAIGPPIDGHLLQLGLNDTFRLRTPAIVYIARVYRHGWRTRAEILYELEALRHLQARGMKVAAPILRRDGELIGELDAPEGVRYLVLFDYAEGEEPCYDAETGAAQSGDRRSDVYLYGRSVAQVHRASDDFACDQPRFTLDLDYLLTHSLSKIQPFLSNHAAVWDELVSLTTRLRQKLKNWPIEHLETGFCHGDFKVGMLIFSPQIDR